MRFNMRFTRLVVFSLIMLLSVPIYADIYVVTDKNSHEVVSVSNEDDCVLQGNVELTVVKNRDISELNLVSAPDMYKFQNGQFIPNMEKLKKREKEELKQFIYAKEEEAIRVYIKNKAIDEMIESGQKFEYKHKA